MISFQQLFNINHHISWIMQYIMLPFIIVSLFITAVHPDDISVGMITNNSQASRTSSVQITIYHKDPSGIDAGSKLHIIFGSEWSVGGVTGGGASDFCETSCTLGTVGLTINSQTVQLDNLYPTAIDTSYNIYYTLNNLINPAYSGTYMITVQLYDSSDSYVSLGVYNVEIQPTQVSCISTPAILTVAASTQYEFSVNPSPLTLPPTSRIYLTFPQQWQNSATAPTFANTTCQSLLNPAITCTPQNAYTLIIDNFLSVDTASSFAFTIDGIINPGSIQNNSEIKLDLYNNSLKMGSCRPPVEGLSIRSVNDFSFGFEDGDGNVSETVTGVLIMQVDEQPDPTDWIEILFPPQYDLGSLTTSLVYLDAETLGVPGDVVLREEGSHKIATLFPFQSNSLAKYTIKLYTLILPPAQKSIDNITIQIYRHGFLIARSSCCSMTPSIRNSTSITVTQSHPVIGEVSVYEVDIVLSVGGYDNVIIGFDAEYTLTQPTYDCSNDVTTTVLVCTRLTGGRIMVSGLPTGLSELFLQIDGIENPSTLNPLSLTALTVDTDGNSIEFFETDYSLTGAQLLSVTVTPDNPITLATTSYQIRLSNSNEVPPSASVRVIFPNQVLLQGHSTCSLNTVVTQCTINTVTNQVDIDIGNGGAIAVTQLNNQNITITDVINPATTAQSTTFKVYVMQGSHITELLTHSITVTMSTIASLASLNVIPNITTTYTIANYNIGFSVNVVIDSVYGGIYSSMWASVQFSDIFQSVSCANCSELFLLPLSTTQQTFTHEIVLQNPYGATYSGSFDVSIYLDGYPAATDSTTLNVWTLHDIAYNVYHQHSFMAEDVTVMIQITDAIPHQVEEVKITIPTDYAVTTIEAFTQNVGTISVVGRQISVMLNEEVEGLSVSISGIANPSTQAATAHWQVHFYDGSSILIAQSTLQPYFGVECTMPCRSCTTSPSECLSCYPISLTANIYLSNNQCISGCNSNQYLINDICYQCDISCATCSLLNYNCTSCPNSTYLYNNLCLPECPNNYYPDSNTNQCTTCVSPCALCTNNTCLYCQSGYVLSDSGTCELTCSLGYYNSSNICQVCGDDCLECLGDGCVTCNSITYLYNGSCLADCPLALYISADGVRCEVCQSPCLTCQYLSSQCTSCDASATQKYLHSSSCLSACPPNTYSDEYFICTACVSPCLECTSPTICTSCQPTYLYMDDSNLCLSECPNNTLQISNECVQCVQPCLSCVGGPTTCTDCIGDYFLDDDTCVLICTLPEFPIERQCLQCAEPCDTCVPLEPYKCKTCINGYYRLQTSCYSECPDGTYFNGVQCSDCTSGCLTCTNTSSTCLSCFPGLYLYENVCSPTCPTSPIYYYEYQSQCIQCQPECSSCLSSPVECESCSSSSDYLNLVTRECNSSCSYPYYSNVQDGVLVCVQCSHACKQCGNSSDECITCFGGKYLHRTQCLSECPAGYWESDSVCETCAQFCARCDKYQSCNECEADKYMFAGICYDVCPDDAPYVYKAYCRNCLVDNCLICNDANQCTYCETPYYNFNGTCHEECPDGYQPDSVTDSRCILTDQAALLSYLQQLEKLKVYLMPGSITFFALLLLLLSTNRKRTAGFVIVGGPQTIAYLMFTIMVGGYFEDADTTIIPSFVVFLLISAFFIINVLSTCLFYHRIKEDKQFLEWKKKDSTSFRYSIVMVFSIFNKKLSMILFSSLFGLPFTSCQATYQTMNKLRQLNWLHGLSLIFIELLYIGYAVYLLFIEKVYIDNWKVMMTGIDSAFLSFVSIVATIVFVASQLQIPQKYSTYLIPGVSNLSLPALSQQLPEDEEDDRELFRSNSLNEIKKSNDEIEEIDFNSTFDPDDFEDPDRVENSKIERGIQNGNYRKSKLKKKKKNRNLFDGGLDIISQESDDEENEKKVKPKKKRKTFRKRNVGYLNNYMYYKPPGKKQKSPVKEFKLHEKEIMEKIKEKQSEFDTITQNDMIFQDENFNSSSSDPDFYQEESRRALNAQYDSFLNRNYANRKHLE